MGRYCAECNDWNVRNDFSANQWRKGDGGSRCYDCVNGTSYNNNNNAPPTYYECHQCSRHFNNQNELNMHLQVHRPRNVACPLCGDRRFASGANAVQHVESGYCTGCRGSDNARNAIYQFAQQQQGMRPYLTDTPMLTNGSHWQPQQGTPEFPYHCGQCQKSFRQASQLLQHNDNKHGNLRMLGY